MEALENSKTIDFGVVEPGRTYTRKLRFKNTCEVSEISSSELLNPLDKVFQVLPETSPSKRNTFVVEFKPVLPFQKSFSYEYVHFENSTTSVLSLKGETIGPLVKISNKRLIFLTTDVLQTSHALITLRNYSNCTEEFQFDYEPSQSSVMCSPRLGTIKGGKAVQVLVTYNAARYGPIYREIPCLFRYEAPRFVEIFGYHLPRQKDMDVRKHISSGLENSVYRTSFCRYVNDCAVKIFSQSRPPFSVSDPYINFGAVPVSGSSFSMRSVAVTNHTIKDAKLIWGKDKNKLFVIEPNEVEIKRATTKKFTITFRPTKSETFYAFEFTGCIQWGSEWDSAYPYYPRVHLIGNSFSVEHCGWAPSYEIETTRIVLPGTIPNMPTYVNFQIKKAGSLPMLFHFWKLNADSRQKSNFVIKPLQGLITDEFQLITVQLFPGYQADVFYWEEWILELNTSVKVKLDLCGNCELPFIRVGEGKKITYSPTGKGGISVLPVPIKNPTRLHLKYHCRESELPVFIHDTTERLIGPGEQQTLYFQFIPQELGNYESTAVFELAWDPLHFRANEGLDQKVLTETVVTEMGSSEFSSLSGDPKYLKMGVVLLHRSSTTTIFLHNEGTVQCHVRLHCEYKGITATEGRFDIEPNDVSLPASRLIEVKLTVYGLNIGAHDFEVSYTLFQTSTFETPIGMGPVPLVRGEIFCEFISFKVVDVHRWARKNMSKYFLWKSLTINELNKVLDNLHKPHATFTVSVRSQILHAPPLIANFILKNRSPVTVLVKYMGTTINCNCVPRKPSITSRNKSKEPCIHEQEVTVIVPDEPIQSEKIFEVGVKLRYREIVESEFVLHFEFETADDLHKVTTSLDVILTRPLIPAYIGNIDLYEPKSYDEFGNVEYSVTFYPINIGPRYHIQAIWLWNETDRDVCYSVEWLITNKLVFTIINPKAVVQSFSKLPLLIAFSPFELKTYNSTFVLTTDSEQFITVHIAATACVQSTLNTASMLQGAPLRALYPQTNHDDIANFIEISMDHICIPPMKTHSYYKHIFFMKNRGYSAVHFKWLSARIWAILDVKVVPSQGILHPGASNCCQLTVQSLAITAKLSLLVECFVTSLADARNAYHATCLMRQIGQVFDSCFTIVPDRTLGVRYEKPDFGFCATRRNVTAYYSIGISFSSFRDRQIDIFYPKVSSQLRSLPNDVYRFDRDQKKNRRDSIKGLDTTLAARTLAKIIGAIIWSNDFKDEIKTPTKPRNYKDLMVDENVKEPAKLTKREVAMVISDLLHLTLSEWFGLSCNFNKDGEEDQPEGPKEPTILYNTYLNDVMFSNLSDVRPLEIDSEEDQHRKKIAMSTLDVRVSK